MASHEWGSWAPAILEHRAPQISGPWHILLAAVTVSCNAVTLYARAAPILVFMMFSNIIAPTV